MLVWPFMTLKKEPLLVVLCCVQVSEKSEGHTRSFKFWVFFKAGILEIT